MDYESLNKERNRRIKAEKKLKLARSALSEISQAYTSDSQRAERLAKLAGRTLGEIATSFRWCPCCGKKIYRG